MIELPNLAWYLAFSTRLQLSPRCPYASVYRCSRYYQSLSLLGRAGSTQIDPKEDNKLKKAWEKTDIWPVTYEQATSISGPADDIKHFSRFCPELSFDRYGLFAAELHKYADEIDVSSAHKTLIRERALPDDWRWNWSHIEPLHYTECQLYSLLKLGKGSNGPKPVFPDIGLPNSITTHRISSTEADDLTAKDVDKLIRYMYEHPEIETFETYYKVENPHLKKALDDFRISGDTVEFHYYKDPDHDLSFIKAHKTAQSDWEKHLVATSPMYSKRVIALTQKERARIESEWRSIERILQKYDGQRIKADNELQPEQYFVFNGKLHYLDVGAAKVLEEHKLAPQHLSAGEEIILTQAPKGGNYNALQMEDILQKRGIISTNNTETPLSELDNFKQLVERQTYLDIYFEGRPQENIARGLLQTFLAKRSYREVKVRGGRSDILVIGRDGRSLYETKIWRGHKYYIQGLKEIEEYIKGENDDKQLRDAFFIIFDPTKNKRAGNNRIETVCQYKVHIIVIHIALPSPSKKEGP